MQVGKTDVFTRTSLKELQDKMRTLCIEEYNKEYNIEATLKQKFKGRNRDIHVSDMTKMKLVHICILLVYQLSRNKRVN